MTSIVLMPSSTTASKQNQQILFGYNSIIERKDEIHEIVYHPSCGSVKPENQKCTNVSVEIGDIASNSRTINAVILNKPNWCWGANSGANEYGLCIGVHRVIPECVHLDANDTTTIGLLGQDLVRLALQYCTTVSEAIDLITNLVQRYHQQQSSIAYSFLLADQHDAWLLETIDSDWAAEHITTTTNWRHHTVGYFSIRTKIDRESAQLRAKAQEAGLWNGSDDFDFASCFQPKNQSSANSTNVEQLLKNAVNEKPCDIRMLMSLLRDTTTLNYSHRLNGGSSQVSTIGVSNSESKDLLVIHYFTGTANPSRSYYKPFLFPANNNNTMLIVASDKTIASSSQSGKLWTAHQKAMLADNSNSNNEIEQEFGDTLRKLEQTLIDELEQTKSVRDLEQPEMLFSDTVESEYRFYA